MTALPEARAPGIETTPGPVQARFGIQWLEADIREATTVMSMPAANMLNPFTGHPTLSPLAVLVDDAGGMVNFYRHGPNEWAVSSELAMDFSPDAMATILARVRSAAAEPKVVTKPRLSSVNKVYS